MCIHLYYISYMIYIYIYNKYSCYVCVCICNHISICILWTLYTMILTTAQACNGDRFPQCNAGSGARTARVCSQRGAALWRMSWGIMGIKSADWDRIDQRPLTTYYQQYDFSPV